MSMDYNVKSSQMEEAHERIKANYAEIISRKMTVPPYEGRMYFEIMYFDDNEKDWHIGYGSFVLEYVQTWLDEEFEPTYKRLDEAITDLFSRAEAAEARAEKAESNAKYWEGVAANWKYTFSNESQARREVEARCKRLDEARERANEACAKWEGKFKMAEAHVRELETTYRIEICDNGPECVELGKVRKALAEAEARAEKAERERDAAVEEIPKICYYCKRRKGWKVCEDWNGSQEAETCKKWEWRGQKEE